MTKKIKLAVLLIFFGLSTFGQINLEQSYNYSGTFTKLAASGYKFFVMDVTNNQCRIYNTNHSLWKTINLSVPSNHYLYDIKYVTENLFTNDNSLSLAYIYYNYDTENEYYTYTTKIIQEDGTVLLTIPGCALVNILQDQGLGTKLLAYVYDYSVFPYTIQTWVYNLPGSLVSVDESMQLPHKKAQKSYPNPATDHLTITYNLPPDIQHAELTLVNVNGQHMLVKPIDLKKNQIKISVAGYPSGTYTFYIHDTHKQLSHGKFIIE